MSSLSGTPTASPSPTSSTRAAPQGGILEGGNPTHYNPKDPIITFIIQAGIIIIFCRILHWPLKRIRQPRVIAEVIGGILLGPSVMGRIPGFTAAIFPQNAMPNLTLVANIGLVLFLFLVGLEVDLRYLVSNWKIATSVGLIGMALPFGLGAAIAWGLYHEFHNEPGLVPISFGVYLLFVGVAMAITAFPVLCRILVELKLLHTPVGVIVLSAGVGNDIVGWVLLALCVALVNSGSGITALYVLLTCIAWILFMVYAVRPVFIKILRKEGSLENGPSQSMVALTLLIALTSAFFTGVIGVHPIFGAFLAGLISPHEGGFAIKVTEKIEDLISSLFLPLYFALSGLNTNLGLLDSGIAWAYVVGVVSVAFFSKFGGAAIAARANGLLWRESWAIGALMSCKGLVELIVLNIGLQAKILSTRTFTIFVIMALVTTFATTPLTAWLYPPWYQKKVDAWKRGEIDWESGKPTSEDPDSTLDSVTHEKLEATKIHKMLIYLRLDNMPPLMTFLALLGGNPKANAAILHPKNETRTSMQAEQPTGPPVKPIEAHGLRLLELTDRESSVMQVSEVDEYSNLDPLVNTFRTMGTMHNLAVSGEVTILPETLFAETLASKAQQAEADFMLLPWSETGSMNESQPISSAGLRNKLSSHSYTSFMNNVLAQTPCNTAIFVNKNFGGSSPHRQHTRPGLFRTKSVQSMSSDQHKGNALASPVKERTHHILCPFIGGVDDRYALRLVLQLAENPDVTATIIHFEVDDNFFDGTVTETVVAGPSSPITPKALDPPSISKEAAEMAARAVTPPSQRDTTFFLSLKNSLPAELAGRVVFETVSASSTPLKTVTERAGEEVGQNPHNAGDLIVLGRNASQVAAFAKEGGKSGDAEGRRCLGALGSEVVNSSLRASVIVVQASSAAI